MGKFISPVPNFRLFTIDTAHFGAGYAHILFRLVDGIIANARLDIPNFGNYYFRNYSIMILDRTTHQSFLESKSTDAVSFRAKYRLRVILFQMTLRLKLCEILQQVPYLKKYYWYGEIMYFWDAVQILLVFISLTKKHIFSTFQENMKIYFWLDWRIKNSKHVSKMNDFFMQIIYSSDCYILRFFFKILKKYD